MYPKQAPPGFEKNNSNNLSELKKSYSKALPNFELNSSINLYNSLKIPSDLQNINLNNSHQIMQAQPGFQHFNTNNSLQTIQAPPGFNTNNLNNSFQTMQTSPSSQHFNTNNSIQAPLSYQHINPVNLNNLNSLQISPAFQNTDQNKFYDSYLIRDIENILNDDLPEENYSNYLPKKNNSNDLFNPVKSDINDDLFNPVKSDINDDLFNPVKSDINYDLSNSSDDEVESVLLEEDFEGTIYDSKYVDIVKYYKEFNILIENHYDVFFININKKKHKFKSFEELYEFHDTFKELYERKNNLKNNKNTKRKKKESFNKRVNEFINKYEIIKIELEEILKFILNDKSKKSNDSKPLDKDFSDDIKIAINNNIEYCQKELDKYYDIFFSENFDNINNPNCNFLILSNYSENFNNIYNKYIEYIKNSYNIKNEYIEKYNKINKVFNFLKMKKLVYDFLNFDNYILGDHIDLIFFNKCPRSKNYNLILTQSNNNNKNYIKIYITLNNLYNKYQYFKDEEFLKLEISKCNIRYEYFKNPYLPRKNNIINFINMIIESFLDKNLINNLNNLKKDYLDIIYDKSDDFFLKKKNIEPSNLKFIEESYNNTFKKYGISFTDHKSILQLNELE
jgi:hypothetical protein